MIVKPMENLSFYARLQRLLSAGLRRPVQRAEQWHRDSRSRRNSRTRRSASNGTSFRDCIYTAAVYDLNRTNVPLADPNNPGFFILSGSNRIRGFETELNGYVTDEWQSKFGYAYTDARVTSNTSATIVAGNRVQLVPLQSVLVVEQVPVHPDVGGLGRRHLLLELVRLVRRHRQVAGLRPLRRGDLRARSTRPGRRSSTSRTSSTKATGRRRTATTTSRRARRGRSA